MPGHGEQRDRRKWRYDHGLGGGGVNWIEQLFGIDPDFGSGSLEMLIAGAVVLVVAGLVVSRRRSVGQRQER